MRGVAAAVLLTGIVFAAPGARAAPPHRSLETLPFSNGFGAAIYDAGERRTTALYEHIFRAFEPGNETRNFLGDVGFVVRAGGGPGVRLADLDGEANYLDAAGIVSVEQSLGALSLETYAFAPWGLDSPGLALLLQVTATERTPEEGMDVTVYGLQDLRLGLGMPETTDEDEQVTFDAASGAFVETGAAGAVAILPLADPSHHACTPNDPFDAATAGRELVDTDSSGVVDGARVGFQWDMGRLGPGQSAWVGFLVALRTDGDQAGAIASALGVRGERDPHGALANERSSWQGFLGDLPVDFNDQAFVSRLALATLRMAQVREASPGAGQIVAALVPSAANATRLRDMAYSVVALVRAGRTNESRVALEFILGADAGAYPELVGEPYGVSIESYFGNGLEGVVPEGAAPLLSLDVFGLFLWAARHHVDGVGDDRWLTLRWPAMRDLVADVLIRRIDETGLVQPDASLWGREDRHFAYTSLAAARGLCDAAALAVRVGETENAERYRQAARNLGRAIVAELVGPSGWLGASREQVRAGDPALDGAVVEAINWEVIGPRSRLARRTLEALDGLEIEPGRLQRSDDGSEADQDESVLVDLRAALAFEKNGLVPAADRLRDWVTAQAAKNFGLLAERHRAQSADYAGEAPLVGLGAAVYRLSFDAFEEDATCFDALEEPDPDAGPSDAGAPPDRAPASCACRAAARGRAPSALVALPIFFVWLRQRGRA